MASTREIRRRITSVRNVAQITRAVQLVASSKMRRAQERVIASRPYSAELVKLLARLASQAEGQEELPLLRSSGTVRKIGIVLITPDRGLAGALSSNTNRRAIQLVTEQRREQDNPNLPVKFIAVGRKGRDFLARQRLDVLAEFIRLGDQPGQADVRAIARTVTDAYLNDDMDQVFLVYPKFVSTVVQQPAVVQLLPVQPPEGVEEGPAPQYIFEPDATTIFAELLPRYIETQIYQPLLETVASFYSAQMVAMRNATDNATELLADLTLTYNKARQAAITTQILEVVAGAGAS